MGNGPSILLVEDNDLVARGVTRWLRCYFARVAVVVTAAQAIEALRAERFAVVLSDYDLGAGFDGAELLALVAREWPAIRRVLYSANDDAELAGPRSRAHAVVRKTAEPAELLAALLDEPKRKNGMVTSV